MFRFLPCMRETQKKRKNLLQVFMKVSNMPEARYHFHVMEFYNSSVNFQKAQNESYLEIN